MQLKQLDFLIKVGRNNRSAFLYNHLLGTGILFGTSYGHDLRVEEAETILTTQHRYLAKYTFLPKEKLDALLDKINNPKWRNSKDIEEKLSPKRIQQKKNEPLDIKIETIHSKETAEWKFVGKLITNK
ncbi:hypothetical protein IIU_05892 [Bacillus cereus VD133]|uniref:Uncharacterized protein n=1 Tax=Bacillus cereus VD133 TaxID=1053233 RepID=A0A9W5PL93_BACCE|nr:hypothetical protein IIU_05892 [Bacillus cereus VD133]